MYRIILSEQARREYLYFSQSGNKAILNKIKNLLEDIAEHPYTGIGKPEPLKYELAGKWSRRINRGLYILYEVPLCKEIILKQGLQLGMTLPAT